MRKRRIFFKQLNLNFNVLSLKFRSVINGGRRIIKEKTNQKEVIKYEEIKSNSESAHFNFLFDDFSIQFYPSD